jgi:hypothetical protein
MVTATCRWLDLGAEDFDSDHAVAVLFHINDRFDDRID